MQSPTSRALFFYGLGTPAFVLIRVLSPVFFARQDTRSPMRFALVSVAVNIVAGAGLFFLLNRMETGGARGAEGIAAATALASWINVAQIVWTLRKRDLWRPSAAAVSRLVRTLAAAAIMGVVLAGLSATRHAWEPVLLRKEFALAAAVAAGGVAYAVLVLLLRVVTPAELRAAVRRRPGDKAAPSPAADA